jgi:hypothetical protein
MQVQLESNQQIAPQQHRNQYSFATPSSMPLDRVVDTSSPLAKRFKPVF